MLRKFSMGEVGTRLTWTQPDPQGAGSGLKRKPRKKTPKRKKKAPKKKKVTVQPPIKKPKTPEKRPEPLTALKKWNDYKKRSKKMKL